MCHPSYKPFLLETFHLSTKNYNDSRRSLKVNNKTTCHPGNAAKILHCAMTCHSRWQEREADSWGRRSKMSFTFSKRLRGGRKMTGEWLSNLNMTAFTVQDPVSSAVSWKLSSRNEHFFWLSNELWWKKTSVTLHLPAHVFSMYPPGTHPSTESRSCIIKSGLGWNILFASSN